VEKGAVRRKGQKFKKEFWSLWTSDIQISLPSILSKGFGKGKSGPFIACDECKEIGQAR